ncbi:MAG: hypothetical protein KDN19_10590 [Verrucomicrobiae bacterium]|nr:hypothetical protein [Verrucomicrobiae bacterium]
MSEASANPNPTENSSEGPTSSPLPGCIILITVVVVFGILATLFTYVFHKQNAFFEDDKVTSAESVEVPQTTPTEAQIKAVDAKVDQLYQSALNNEVTRVEFTAEDLNTLIATRDLLADFRGQTYVKSISEKGIETEMSQPIRTGFLRQAIRFLHGEFWLKPERSGKTILFRVVDIKLPHIEVPEGMVSSYPTFMKLDHKREPFDKVLPQIGNTYVEADHLVVETRALDR